MHQKRLAGRQGNPGQVGRHRGRDFDHPGSGDQIDPFWWPDDLTRRHRDQFGVAATGQQGHAGLTDLPALDTRADGVDVAGHLEPDDVGRPVGRRVVALPLQQVGPVDPRSQHGDHHLARPRHRVGHLGQLQHLGPAETVRHDRSHGPSLARVTSVGDNHYDVRPGEVA